MIARDRVLVLVLILTAMLVVILAGCNGVWTNAEFSKLLDEAAVLSKVDAEKAVAGEMTPEQMVRSLSMQADIWRLFKNAKDGVKSDE